MVRGSLGDGGIRAVSGAFFSLAFLHGCKKTEIGVQKAGFLVWVGCWYCLVFQGLGVARFAGAPGIALAIIPGDVHICGNRGRRTAKSKNERV